MAGVGVTIVLVLVSFFALIGLFVFLERRREAAEAPQQQEARQRCLQINDPFTITPALYSACLPQLTESERQNLSVTALEARYKLLRKDFEAWQNNPLFGVVVT